MQGCSHGFSGTNRLQGGPIEGEEEEESEEQYKKI